MFAAPAPRIQYRFLGVILVSILAGQPPGTVKTRPAPASSLNQPVRVELSSGYGKLPLAFEPNVGQVDERVRFLTRSGGMTTFFTDTETVMVLSRSLRQPKKPGQLGRREAASG